MKLSNKVISKINKIEEKIGNEKLNKQEKTFLLKQFKHGYQKAGYVYGLYLIFEEKNTKKAIDLIKIKHNKRALSFLQ